MEEIPHRGFGMIAVVFSLLIVAATVFIAFSLYTGQGKLGEEDIRIPVERARSVECEAQIRKVKIQVDLYQFDNGRYPERLSVLDDLTVTDLCCPVTGSPYDYDAGSGTVSCPDH
jgi:competence protein ComGC